MADRNGSFTFFLSGTKDESCALHIYPTECHKEHLTDVVKMLMKAL